MLLSAHQAGNFFAVFIAGYLPYVIGRKKSTLYLSSGKAIGLLLMILTGNPILLTLAFILTGIGRGTQSNITNVVTAEISQKKASALNILHSTFAVGAFISPFLVMMKINSSYFSKLFKEYFHKSFVEYLTDIRLEKAKALLLSGETVQSTAEKTGFSDHTYFARVFKQKYGASPTDYKKVQG